MTSAIDRVVVKDYRQTKTPHVHVVFLWWAGKDSNLRRRKPADLQSALFDHFSTYPPRPCELHFVQSF